MRCVIIIEVLELHYYYNVDYHIFVPGALDEGKDAEATLQLKTCLNN